MYNIKWLVLVKVIQCKARPSSRENTSCLKILIPDSGIRIFKQRVFSHELDLALHRMTDYYQPSYSVHGYTITSPYKTRTEYFISSIYFIPIILHTVLYILTY